MASICVRLQGQEVTWLALWRHMSQDCEAAFVLRLALDDANAGVVATAAAALHALLGTGPPASELELLDSGEGSARSFVRDCGMGHRECSLPTLRREQSTSSMDCTVTWN